MVARIGVLETRGWERELSRVPILRGTLDEGAHREISGRLPLTLVLQQREVFPAVERIFAVALSHFTGIGIGELAGSAGFRAPWRLVVIAIGILAARHFVIWTVVADIQPGDRKVGIPFVE